MSLINEALKKARVEAAQRDAERRGVLVPKAAALEPRRRGGRAAAWALAAVAALGLAAAGGMWLARRGAAEADPPAAAAAELPAPVDGARRAGPEAGGAGGEGETVESGEGPASAGVPGAGSDAEPPEAAGDRRLPGAAALEPPAGGADAPRPAAPAPAPPPPDRPVPVPDAGSAIGSDGPPPVRPAAPADPPAPAPRKRPPAAPSAAEGYLREAPLPSGGSIRLDGIVWSETQPAAVIEGQVVGPGEYVRGARIVRVERHRVVLDLDGSEIVIRLR